MTTRNKMVDGVVIPLTSQELAVTPPVLNPVRIKAKLTAHANAKQWAIATGGTTVSIDGTLRRFNTDDGSRADLTAQVVAFGLPAEIAPTSVNWQFADGSFATISASGFVTAALTVMAWFQGTFDKLQTVLGHIADGTVTTNAQIDSALA